jgi:hypothetical protein
MTIQVATRFPDEVAAGIDSAVRDGWAPHRSALIVRAVERELRRAAAARDLAILQADQRDDDLGGLVTWNTARLQDGNTDA